MYRHGPAVASAQLPSPSPDASSDPNCLAVTQALIRKRSQVDEEIQEFRARKEQEFRDFERDLRNRAGNSRRAPVTGNSSTLARSSLLSFLPSSGIKHKAQSISSRDGDRSPRHEPMQVDGQSEPAAGRGQRPVPKSHVQCTASTIRSPGNDEPHLMFQPESTQNDLSGPPIYNGQLAGHSNRYNSNHLDPISSVHPHTSLSTSTSKADLSSYTTHDRDIELQGLFTPHYLSLLDPKHCSLPESCQQISQSGPEPRLGSSGPSIVPSTSLTSALRRSSSEQKKSKHVLFRLSDTAIVEPSSSYEERSSMSSPKEVSPLCQRMLEDNAAGYSTPVRASTPSLSVSSKDAKATEDGDENLFALDEEYNERLSSARNSKVGNKQRGCQVYFL